MKNFESPQSNESEERIVDGRKFIVTDLSKGISDAEVLERARAAEDAERRRVRAAAMAAIEAVQTTRHDDPDATGVPLVPEVTRDHGRVKMTDLADRTYHGFTDWHAFGRGPED